ncbi:MAG: hypothetical protein JO001_09990 [Alphaproteobacteria bacterium]|nr:hypothetical protein [Alphaproteobacteria bacterium]
MRTLKVAVIIMGVMLVVGFAALIVVIAQRLSHPPAAPAAIAAATGVSPGRVQPFTAAPVDLPPGSRIETIGMSVDRLVLAVALADGTRQIIILDAADGHRIGLIPLRPRPSPETVLTP